MLSNRLEAGGMPGLRSLACAGVVALLSVVSGCSGGSSSSTATNDGGATTTLGTRGAVSQLNPAITSNARGAWIDYTRDDDYPKVYKYPLQFITLKSGQKLGVLVGVPADSSGKAVDGSFPVVLTQTAYRIDLGADIAGLLPTGSTLIIGGPDPFLIKHGYVTVSVDVLGSGVSDGEEHLLDATEQEAYGEVVDWVLQQPWSNGKIGLAGTSYLGITSLLTAEQQNPAIKAVFVDVPMGDAWRAVIGTGGLLNGLFISYWLPLTQSLSVQNATAEKDNPQYANQIAAATRQHIDTIDDFFLPLINDSLAGQTGYATDDGDFWSVRSTLEHADRIQVPTFIIGGSSDIFQRDEPLLYERLKRNVNAKLLIVPGAHVESAATAAISAFNNTQNGAPASSTLLLQWFDEYLKGMNTGADKVPNVTQYVSGYGDSKARYATTTDWPHPLAAPQRLYLHGDMSLSSQAPSANEATHTVVEAPAPEVSAAKSQDGTTLQMTAVAHDGSDCSISYVQWSLGIAGLVPKACYSNDVTVETSQDALDYDTATMNSDYYFNGPIEADIWMSTTAAQAAISVRVDDIGTDGTATPLTDGLLSAKFRAVDDTRSRYLRGVMIQPWHPDTVASEMPVTAGEPMLLPIEIFPAAALIRAGHHLRIAISSSNQSQGGWSTPDQVAANGGVSTIYNDPEHASSIVLPVVPASVLPK